MGELATDVHQHLWPDELVDRLRARTRPPYLRGWTLHTDGDPPFEVDPQAHDPRERPAVREAARRLAQLVESLLATLPTAPGGQAQVLYGQDLAWATPEPDPHARDLLVYLGGEVQDTEWQGLPIRWQQIGKNWQLQVGRQMLILYPHLSAAERQLSVTEGGVTLRVFYGKDYMLL